MNMHANTCLKPFITAPVSYTTQRSALSISPKNSKELKGNGFISLSYQSRCITAGNLPHASYWNKCKVETPLLIIKQSNLVYYRKYHLRISNVAPAFESHFVNTKDCLSSYIYLLCKKLRFRIPRLKIRLHQRGLNVKVGGEQLVKNITLQPP